MARTTEALVGKIVDLDDTIDVDPFIEIATLMVDDVIVPASDYSATRLEQIERYLAAHFYALKDQQPASEGAGSVSVSYQNRVDLYLNFTRFGQMAMTLDIDGILAALQKKMSTGKRSAGVTHLGLSTREQEAAYKALMEDNS
jgi:hypothetical protein